MQMPLHWTSIFCLAPLTATSLIFTAGCGPDLPIEELRAMGPLSPSMVPPSPTNAVADTPRAAALGQALFFDEQLSADGAVSCASCHDPRNNFADTRPLSLGVEEREGTRHAPTLMNLAFQDFYFWDGRTDSLWSTPLQAIEAEAEGDFSRVEVAHLMAERHREGYEAVFGPLPSLDGFPAQGQPGEGPWQALSPSQQETINRIFANTGKALEAYQRQLVCADTKFDRVMAGEAQFTEPEAEGARHFVGSGKCAACHSGINFSDSGFHRVPIPGLGADDLGRAEGVASLLENIFNSAGDFSDDAGAGADILAEVDFDPSDRGAFKTPTLRGVAQRRTFGHLGSVRTLEGWLEEVYMRRGRGGQRGGAGGDGFAPELDGIRFNPRAMAAFLRTLNCAPLPAALTQPPGQD